MVRDVAAAEGIGAGVSATGALERAIAESVARRMLEKMSAEEVAAAQASGFGVYMLASTVVGSVSATLGVSLGFGFYTLMAKAISIAIGPVGITAVAGRRTQARARSASVVSSPTR